MVWSLSAAPGYFKPDLELCHVLFDLSSFFMFSEKAVTFSLKEVKSRLTKHHHQLSSADSSQIQLVYLQHPDSLTSFVAGGGAVVLRLMRDKSKYPDQASRNLYNS